MPKKRKPARKTKKPTATIPAWACPKCGATHPITVPTCCKRAAPCPLPSTPKPPTRVRLPRPFDTPYQPGIIPLTPYDPRDYPRNVPQWWTWPPSITCTVHPSAGPDYQNPGLREVQP